MPIRGGKIWFAFSLIAFVVSFGIATALGFLKPYTNWDMVAYVGSAISWQERAPAEIHRKTLEDIEQGVSSKWRKEIAETNARSNDPAFFVQNLPFYKNKPAYIASVWLIRAMGLAKTYSAATWIVAALSFACFGILLLLWQPEHVNHTLWLLTLAAFCWFGNHPLSNLARFSTPDSLAMVPIFGSFLALFRLKSPRLGIALMLSAIMVRPETAMLAVLMATIFCVMDKSCAPLAKAQSAIMGIASIGLYFSIQKLSGNYGYEKFFYYTYVNSIPNPAEVEVHLTLHEYWQALFSGLRHITADSRLIPFLILSATAAYCYSHRRSDRGAYPWLLLLAWASFAVRFLLLPSWNEYRYYSINYLLMLIASCEMIAGFQKYSKAQRLEI
jgi:hypothetical protein